MLVETQCRIVRREAKTNLHFLNMIGSQSPVMYNELMFAQSLKVIIHRLRGEVSLVEQDTIECVS